MGDRDYKNSKRPLLGQTSNTLILLIAINAFIFIILNFLRLVFAISYETQDRAESFFQKNILNGFSLGAEASKLLSHPWVFVVFMFSHYSVWSFISNMLWLWWFGYILQDLTGNKKLISIYLFGGLAGGLFFLLSMNFLPYLHHEILTTAPLLGAGASVMAVAVATTTLTPNYKIFPFINGGIPLWVLTLVYVAIDFASIAGVNGGYALAHLAGAATGFLFITQLKKGNDWGAWMFWIVEKVDDYFSPAKKKNKLTAVHGQLFYKTDKQPYTKTPKFNQQKLDAILDKINLHGFHSLTDEEKKLLQDASKEDLI